MKTIFIQPKQSPVTWDDEALEDEECIIVCPFCGHFKDVLQHIDYVTDPMIWCDKCKARSVIDKTINKIPISKDQLNSIQNIDDIVSYCNGFFEDDTNECEFYYVELLYIKKCINIQLIDFAAEYEVPQNIIRELILYVNVYRKYTKDQDEKLLELLNNNKIVEREWDNEYMDVNNFNVSVTIESYNNNVSIPNFDLSHDGITIYLLCENSKGESVIVSYWGD